MVVKGCGKGCKSRLFLVEKRAVVNLFGVDMGCVVGGHDRRGEVGGCFVCGKKWWLGGRVVVKVCGKGCKSRLFLVEKRAGVNLFGVDIGYVVWFFSGVKRGKDKGKW